jgi:hypothetical protein
VGVLGSCLAGMTAAMLVGDYRWVRLNNAAVDRSDLFAKNVTARTRQNNTGSRRSI